MDEVKERWNEYIQELFWDQRPGTLILSTNDDGLTILKIEIRFAMRSMKKGKAVGDSSVAQKMILALEEFCVNELTKLFNENNASGNNIE